MCSDVTTLCTTRLPIFYYYSIDHFLLQWMVSSSCESTTTDDCGADTALACARSDTHTHTPVALETRTESTAQPQRTQTPASALRKFTNTISVQSTHLKYNMCEWAYMNNACACVVCIDIKLQKFTRAAIEFKSLCCDDVMT